MIYLLAINKSPQKNKFRVHSIYTIEKVSDSSASTDVGTEADHITADIGEIISQKQKSVKRKLSDRDSSGRKLTEAQAGFFKDSKARNKDGNLLVLFHGTTVAGFTSFDPSRGRYGAIGSPQAVWMQTPMQETTSTSCLILPRKTIFVLL